MFRQYLFLSVVCQVFLLTGLASAAAPDLETDWPWWRGPKQNGVATANQNPPTDFNERKNVLWKVDVPGRGHSSPVIVGERIFLATADEQNQVQGVICFDRETGQQQWITPCLEGKFPPQIHQKNTHASGTISCNGDRLFAVFFNDLQIKVTCLSVTGEQIWSKSAGRFNPQKFKFGYGASPVLYQDMVLVTGDADSGSYIVAFAQQDGEERWRIERAPGISFSTPVVAHVAGRDQLLISGLNEVASYDPSNGSELWSVPGTTDATCGTMVWDGDNVFASGGYPKAETIAVKADGSGKILWTNNKKCYEQSMLAHDGYLYALADKGVMYCWRASDGKEMWVRRLGGDVSSSPILVGDTIYAGNESGEIFIFKANPNNYEEIARTKLGTELFATPSFVDSKIYYRVASGLGPRRQEFLYCIGTK